MLNNTIQGVLGKNANLQAAWPKVQSSQFYPNFLSDVKGKEGNPGVVYQKMSQYVNKAAALPVTPQQPQQTQQAQQSPNAMTTGQTPIQVPTR